MSELYWVIVAVLAVTSAILYQRWTEERQKAEQRLAAIIKLLLKAAPESSNIKRVFDYDFSEDNMNMNAEESGHDDSYWRLFAMKAVKAADTATRNEIGTVTSDTVPQLLKLHVEAGTQNRR